MKLKLTLAFTVCLSTLSATNLFTDPSFETLPISNTYEILAAGDTTSLPGWTVTGGDICSSNCVMLMASTYTESSGGETLTFQPHSGNQSLDITGAYNSIVGGVEQTVNLTPGLAYGVNFWLGNMGDPAGRYPLASAIEVLVNGVSVGVFSNNASNGDQVDWQQVFFSFVASTSSTTIQFQNATPGGDNYAGLDDVFIDIAPEPSTTGLAVFALGLLGFGVRRRHS